MNNFWPATLVDWAQIASAIGTCGAVIASLILANRRIQTKIETTCTVKRGIGAPGLKVVIRNVGRDTIYLRGIGGVAADGSEKFNIFIEEEGHLIIPPGAPNTVALERCITVTERRDGLPQQWVRMWVEDVSGKRYHIKGSSDCLAEIWAEMEPKRTTLIASRDIPM
jgi:hypothetical protein